ncbi:hypothetical protein N474_03555 [Pseudoalteromonas luteoviolacea CPMOR-2]|uniref:DUF3087 domain-containing protein n=1 Tax=Pseudoalteromonas luteoviolacea DSM 6061 TaxID=1365250 RepID=A0A166VEZ4_9GAMM|nr:DUF3087 domain-containing protein [Pseudoalteromonas luteoviolacea]KZN32613.1 hypothetical protein N475_21495 [Pseudoalteromonas luteoviolacea DSM 6061]KZN50464.1 hypothetical protein N474_03555 [Pseudoalteromonas luteoviolacea CPMOR-2]MBE0385083.1 hypothetical protein [Pseudoalteromonas luteoviolacea DSM 6061]
MQLQEIDKSRYRNHLNKVIGACIAALTIGSLGIAQTLILLFPDADGSHFHWNLLGVVISCSVIFYVLRRVKLHPFMVEVVYVWELKQALNRITRKMPKLKKAAQQGNVNAMLAIHYSYAGSRQLWMLDDNTITMEELAIWQAELDALAAKYQVSLDAADYDEGILRAF